MLVSSRKTTQLEFILLDECRLTGVRTAAAGAVVGAPRRVERSGVFSGGVHGKMQVEALLPIVESRLSPIACQRLEGISPAGERLADAFLLESSALEERL
jgi:ornithine cyclodeaminase/alanine dehydrogenase-like protein (mu-crystallin family)